MIFVRTFLAGLASAILCLNIAAEDKGDAAGLEFFENKIRPVLSENCYKCHSEKAEKVKGGLLLDTREAMLKGGDTGASVVPAIQKKAC